jgi:hypothetical protein
MRARARVQYADAFGSTGHNLTLFFADFETIVLFVSVILVSLLIMWVFSQNEHGLVADWIM